MAWTASFLEWLGVFSYYGTYQIESNMLDTEPKFIVNYKHGLPPYFNKRMFTFKPPNVLGMGDPLNILLEHNPNKTTNFVQKVVRSYRKNFTDFTRSDRNVLQEEG
jgi:hypothetical protein